MRTAPPFSVPIPPLYQPNGDPNIRALVLFRLQHGLSMADTARLLGVSDKTYRRWENAQSWPRGRNLTKLHDFLQASAAIMERHGTIPPGLSFRHQLPGEHGDARCAIQLASENRQLKEALKGAITELDAQLRFLRSLAFRDSLNATAGD